MSYPDKFPRDSFKTHINVSHEPSGFKFYQQGGRIIVLQKDDDGFYRMYSDFSVMALQEFGTALTEARLIRAAISWLQNNWVQK